MNDGPDSAPTIDLRSVAAATAVVIAMIAASALAYLLLDILLLLFIGIVVAAALQPWHVALGRRGVPKGIAVLLIYLLLLVGLGLMVLIVGPVLIEQSGRFVSEIPQAYRDARSWLETSTIAPIRFLAQRIPTFDRLAPALTAVAPQLAQGTLGVTTSIVMLPGYFVTVLAVGFYWTMEVAQFERLVLSQLPVERRPRALNTWHEIESKLGGFLRGQGMAMLFIAAASSIGYALIGLPNVLALGVLAGLLEAVPWIGPVLAIGPALLVALPMGSDTVLMVVGLALLLQALENNVLIPRIMHHTVGVSALVSLLAILAFGTLYGILGVLIAIPMAAVIQVLLDSLVVNVEALASSAGLADSPWVDLRTRVNSLRQQARMRLRSRSSRMGIDPETADHVVDALDQQIESAVARVERIISVVEQSREPLSPETHAAIAEKLHSATLHIEQAVERVDASEAPEEEAGVSVLSLAAQGFEEELEKAESLVVASNAAPFVAENRPAAGAIRSPTSG